MLLCAGYGTRLGDLGVQLPKPLLPVCGIPIIRYGVQLLVSHGITDIAINLHHQGNLIEKELGDGSSLGANIYYSTEETILGTGGGLKHALDFLDADGSDEPFLSLNGKLIFDLDIADVLGRMVVRSVPDAVKWGAVDVHDEDGVLRIKNILGEGRHMFGGIHLTRPSVVRRLPDGDACMIRQGYLPWLLAGEPVAAHVAGDVYFAEHSTPARYLQSNIDLIGGAKLTHPPARLRGVDVSAHIASTARIKHPVRISAGARIGDGATVGPDVVLGEKAIVDSGAVIERAVVWAGARASGQVKDCVVTANGTVDASDVDAK
jgi:NDP-sugar pyrophosphorylase family protein